MTTPAKFVVFFILISGPVSAFGTYQSVKKFSVLERPVERPATPKSETHPPQSGPMQAKSRSGQIELNRLLTRLARKHIPHTFTEDKDWGMKERRWNGVEIKREGLKIKTKRKWKEVNHGTWKKYSVQMRNPDQEFFIELKNLREVREQTAGFDIHFTAHLDLQARQSKWVKGVQLYSLSASGHAQVRLVIYFELKMNLEFEQLPPDLVLSPKATGADLIVDEFRIDRVGKIGGELAQQITRFARKKLDEKIASKKKKLVQKINKEISENREKLRLSPTKLDKKWLEAAAPFLETNQAAKSKSRIKKK